MIIAAPRIYANYYLKWSNYTKLEGGTLKNISQYNLCQKMKLFIVIAYTVDRWMDGQTHNTTPEYVPSKDSLIKIKKPISQPIKFCSNNLFPLIYYYIYF